MHLFRGDETAEERIALAAEFARDGARLPVVAAVAGACVRAARRRAEPRAGYPLALAYLDAVVSAVQSLPYRPDPPGRDVLRDAAETLAEGGDCEDKAALVVSLVVCGRRLLALEIGACVVWIRQRAWPDDHVSAWVWMGRDPSRGAGVIEQGDEPPRGAWWAETTVAAARGESPYAAAARIGGAHDRIAH